MWPGGYDLLRSESVFLSPESRCPTWNEALRRYVDVKRCLSSWKDAVIPGHTEPSSLLIAVLDNYIYAINITTISFVIMLLCFLHRAQIM